MPHLIKGAGISLFVALIAELIGTALGLLLALVRLYGPVWLRIPAIAYVDLMRGTPMLVQILFAYFALPSLISQVTGHSFDIQPLHAGIVALGLNSAAYVSEVYRSTIGSIDRGQSEAARSLGLNWRQAMRYVVLPQAFRIAVPPLGNEFITLVKDTSLLSVIAVNEIVKEGQIYIGRTYAAFPAYLGIALTYLLMTVTISALLRQLERRLRIP